MDRRPARLAALGLLVAVAALGVASGVSRQAPGALATFRSEPLLLDHPAAWGVYRYNVVASFFSLQGYIATFEIPDPCRRSTLSLECGLAGYELPEGGVVLTIMGQSWPGGNILDDSGEGAVSLRIQGLPAWRRDLGPDRHTGADEVTEWLIARPDSINNWVSIRADLRGPDLPRLRREVEAVIASVSWDPPVLPIDRGPSGRMAAAAALGRYLDLVAENDGAYGCFPRSDGEVVGEVGHSPGGPVISGASIVTCSTELVPTEYDLWAARLTMRWGTAPYGGRWETTLYINGAGDVIGGTMGATDELPGAPLTPRDSHG